MRHSMVMPLLLFPVAIAAPAQVSVGISVPGLSIGINQPLYPSLVPVPGCPVYYAPASPYNYFFYDGMFWVFQNDEWYCSQWFNGPWYLVDPLEVPVFLLRVPVRCYRRPPPYFTGWHPDAPPHWGEHWGRGWEQRRRGWDHWDRSAAPAPAPLPVYQRQYGGDRYPPVDQQQRLQAQNYRYLPKDAGVRARYLRQRAPAAPRGQAAPQPQTRPAHTNPPLVRPQAPPPPPGNPNPTMARPQPPEARPESPNPPPVQPHRPLPENHEAPHENRERPKEPVKGAGPG